MSLLHNPANISCFPRCLEDVFSVHFPSSKTSWRRLQEVFVIRLPKTSSRRVCKTSCNFVFKTSSRRLGRQKKCYTEDGLKASSVRLHQDKCLLGTSLAVSQKKHFRDNSNSLTGEVKHKLTRFVKCLSRISCFLASWLCSLPVFAFLHCMTQ